MSGIYIHIPFCKQACHYCDFHFSTSLKKKEKLINALCIELKLRKVECIDKVETIYFGGGTPSLLSIADLRLLIAEVNKNYEVSENPEITLEANPDDIISGRALRLRSGQTQSRTIFEDYGAIGVNRLSIGIQSFFDEDLKLMNRVHNATEALESVIEAKKYFENISIDLIYGIPGMTALRWKENLKIAIELDIPHLSCYALTVEPKTALEKFIAKGIVAPMDEEMAKQHYEILLRETEKAVYENYEFSNFGKPGFFSRNNTGYWQGKPYLGIGPSAHSFDGKTRRWNVANNSKYIKSIEAGIIPSEVEILTKEDRYNEYIMTGLRTKWGVSVEKIKADFGNDYSNYLLKQAENHLQNNFLVNENEILKISKKGKFLSDGIASDLFMV